MQDDSLPREVRVRWGRVALAAIDRCADVEATHDLDRAIDVAYVRCYLIQRLGQEHAEDPAALCAELLGLIDLTPQEAAAQGPSWRELPVPRIRELRRVKRVAYWLSCLRPHLAADDPLTEAVDAWTAVRDRLP